MILGFRPVLGVGLTVNLGGFGICNGMELGNLQWKVGLIRFHQDGRFFGLCGRSR